MQQNSFSLGCNYSNRSLYPVQKIDVNGNVDGTFSLLYCDIYFRRLKEELKHTMLVHESVFESQIHELHRLYRRQKELMMEMEGTRHHEASYLNSSFHEHRTHWLNSSGSTYQTRNLPSVGNIPNQIEGVYNVDKSEKKVLDLESPVSEYDDMNREVHKLPNFLKEQSLELGKHSNKLQLDLNEPAAVEEHSDYVINQFCSSVTSNEVGEEFDIKNEGEDFGIDLNVSLFSSEEVTTEEPQASFSVSLNGKYGSEQSRVIVQALPCSSSILLVKKRCKPLMRGSRRKVKLGSSNKSHSNQASMEKGTSSSKVKSARNRTSLGEKRRLKPRKKSSNGHKAILKKGRRTKPKKSRSVLSLVTEGNYQETCAAEAIVDMSRKSGQEWITYLSSNLLWFAEISSLVVEEKEVVDWGDIKKRQRGSRVPATEFHHMIIS